jgi:hypothetical protein
VEAPVSGTLDIVRPAAGSGITCLAFNRIERRGSLVGFADLHIVGYRMRLFSCPVHEQNGKRWVGLPARPWLDRDNQLVRDPDTGKAKWQPIITFDSRDILARFSDAAVAAVATYDAGAFDE